MQNPKSVNANREATRAVVAAGTKIRATKLCNFTCGRAEYHHVVRAASGELRDVVQVCAKTRAGWFVTADYFYA